VRFGTVPVTEPRRPASAAVSDVEAARREGRLEATREFEARFGELMRGVGLELDRLRARYAAAIAGVEPQLVRLALAAAEKVLRRPLLAGEIDLRPLLAEGIRKLSEGLPEPANLRLRLSPADRRALEPHLASLGTDRIVLEEDSALPRGRCTLLADVRSVAIDLEREFERLAELILDSRSERV
jgi:flagellar biosynthesis/type III secretory pathway protein FliH